jgi:REP element-mobilizing transposase RayT
VWTPKYRRSVLVGPMARRCEQLIRQVATTYLAEISALEIMPDHGHGRVEVDPQFAVFGDKDGGSGACLCPSSGFVPEGSVTMGK